MSKDYETINNSTVSVGLKKLIGHKVIDMSVEENRTLLVFILDGAILRYRAVGDCCSESWLENVDRIPPDEIIQDAFAKSVVNLTGVGKFSDMNIIEQYFYEIITDKGSYTIEMRNSSNGYYGGWLELVREESYLEQAE